MDSHNNWKDEELQKGFYIFLYKVSLKDFMVSLTQLGGERVLHGGFISF